MRSMARNDGTDEEGVQKPGPRGRCDRMRWLGPTAPSAPSTRGIALMDVLLAITIIGIMSAISMRTLRSEEWDLDATARAIAADLTTAQTLALETGVALGVAFEAGTNKWHFVLADGTTPDKSEAALRASPSVGAAQLERLLAARARGEAGFGSFTLDPQFGGRDRLAFEADGSTAGSGYVQVGRGDAWLRVRVQVATGRVTVTAP